MRFDELFAYVWYWVKPCGMEVPQASKMFDVEDLCALRKISCKLGKGDPAWFPRLFEPATFGIRSWEYGLLLKGTKFRKKTVLDVGCGNSRLPLYLSKSGASVTMLDINEPLEKTAITKDRHMKFVIGDMTNLAFADNTFDRVICISAIEHVDMKSGGKYFPESEYIRRALQSIKEMARVTKRHGLFYLTTDFYLPQQKTDKWPGSVRKIRGAFPWRCVDKFVMTMEKDGIKLVGSSEFNSDQLKKSKKRANYRGRFFTTIAFMGTKS